MSLPIVPTRGKIYDGITLTVKVDFHGLFIVEQMTKDVNHLKTSQHNRQEEDDMNRKSKKASGLRDSAKPVSSGRTANQGASKEFGPNPCAKFVLTAFTDNSTYENQSKQ